MRHLAPNPGDATGWKCTISSYYHYHGGGL